VKHILPRYLAGRFLGLFLFTLLGAALLFVVVDLVENVDRFIDARAPWPVTLRYYLYFTPYILILTMPVATLLATVFSMGILAKNNEIVAMKALGYSFYRVMGVFLATGAVVSVFSFVLAEAVAIPANLKKIEIQKSVLDRDPGIRLDRFRNLLIQDPPDRIVAIEFFDPLSNTGRRVTIETFRGNSLVERLDADEMTWDGKAWRVRNAYRRAFADGRESVFADSAARTFRFHFTPRELASAQVKPDEMRLKELIRFIRRVRLSKGEVHRWRTDLHMRMAFPASNLLIVLLAAPLAYNRRKKSLAVGFGISLIVCFVFFGLVKLGETLGHNRSLNPVAAAWMGNAAALAAGLISIRKTRK
jgi:lipopolysaccharide export system permease protein